MIVKCKVCKYEWWPRKEPERIIECPDCKSRRWHIEQGKGGSRFAE